MKLLGLLLLTATALAGPDALALLKQAQERIEALDLPGAETALDAALKAAPRIKDAYVARAHLRLKLSPANIRGAARDFERAARLGADTWRTAARLYHALSEYEHEARAYEQAWGSGDEDSKDLAGVALARANSGDLNGALFAYNELIDLSGPKPSVDHLAERAEIRSMLGEHAAALEDVELGLKVNAGWFRGHQIRGRIQMRMGLQKAALASYKEALRLEPGVASCYFILGLANYDLGNWKDAIRGFKRTLSFGADAHSYAILYLFLARCRSGEPALRMEGYKELMKQVAERRKGTEDWFGKIAGFLVGTVGEEELLEAARKGSRYLRRERLCEAYAYIGARMLLADEKAAARENFRKSVDTGVYTFMEYRTAWCELRRLR